MSGQFSESGRVTFMKWSEVRFLKLTGEVSQNLLY